MSKILRIGIAMSLLMTFATVHAVEVSIDPPEGDIYGTIKDITITFPEGYDISFTGAATRSTPTISGPESASMKPFGYSFSGNVMKFELGYVGVSLPGEYTLNVPANSYSVKDGTSEELNFHYRIVAGDQIKEYTVTPDPAADQTDLGSIVVTFPHSAFANLTDGLAVALEGPKGECEVYVESNSNYVLILPQDNATADDGEYTLKIDAGAISLSGDYTNDEITAKFNVKHTVSEIAAFSPSPGEYYSLQHFELRFYDYDNISANFSADACPYLLNTDTNTVAATCTKANSTGDGGLLSFTFDDEITTIGSYQLVVPGACYKIGDDAGSDLSATYTIVKNNDAYYWESVPANEDIVTKLTSVEITFPNAAGVAKTSTASVSLTDDFATKYNVSMSLSGRKVTVSVNDELTNGLYTLSIPTESFTITDAEGGSYTNRPIEIKITVDSTSVSAPILINDITTEPTIYDLNGRRIDGRPDAGLYIINGAKVLIK